MQSDDRQRMDLATSTAISGIAAFLLTMAQIPLWFIYSGPPPAKNVLLRTFIALPLMVCLLVFVGGISTLIRQTDASYNGVATISLSIGSVFGATTLVAHSVQVGSVLGAERRIDPTTLGSGGEGALLIYGPINHLLMASYLIAASVALAGSGMMPMWVSILGYAIGAFQLALVPTLFYKTDPAHFYSLNGWNIPVSGGFFLTWVLVVSVLLLL
jgi:hypothetical protein